MKLNSRSLFHSNIWFCKNIFRFIGENNGEQHNITVIIILKLIIEKWISQDCKRFLLASNSWASSNTQKGIHYTEKPFDILYMNLFHQLNR